MDFFNRFRDSYVRLDNPTVQRLSQPNQEFRFVEVHPPADQDLPVSLDRFVKTVTEYQTQLLGIKNTSPVIGYEIQRFTPEKIRLQFAVPTARLERKLRTQLNEQIPGIGFETGTRELPLNKGDTVGLGVLSLRRKEVYPLETEFEAPPINSVVTALHRHAMRDSRIAIQVLFKPVAGQPVQRRLWHREASRESRNLRSEKVGMLPWSDRDATPREKQQARQIDSKAGSPRFHVSIRILVVGAAEYTASRIKEVSGGFNIFTNPDTGQGYQTRAVRSIRDKPIINSVEQFRNRRLKQPFQISAVELAGLVSIPDREQENIETSV
ncbi:hypothetical protein [Halosimplex salinum]|uniref:hypothetical protein n=1 Tax=Halosimplex salinum TaxID=1710538 RepID=UPI0013DE13D2|nr:hypothetical protein [Halosimplex salinum]